MLIAPPRFDETARALLQAETEPGAPAESAWESTALRVWEKLARALDRLIGVAGFGSVFSRNLIMLARTYPWLAEAAVPPSARSARPWTLLVSCLQKQEAPARDEAHVALVAAFLGLLGTFIGDHLVMRLLHEVWSNALPQPASEEP